MSLLVAEHVALAIEVEVLANGKSDSAGNGHGQGIAHELQIADIIVDVLDAFESGRIVLRAVSASAGGEEMQSAELLAEAGGDDVFIVETGDVQVGIHSGLPPSLKNIVMTYT